MEAPSEPVPGAAKRDHDGVVVKRRVSSGHCARARLHPHHGSACVHVQPQEIPVPLACGECHVKKRKCDGHLPCAPCRERGLTLVRVARRLAGAACGSAVSPLTCGRARTRAGVRSALGAAPRPQAEQQLGLRACCSDAHSRAAAGAGGAAAAEPCPRGRRWRLGATACVHGERLCPWYVRVVGARAVAPESHTRARSFGQAVRDSTLARGCRPCARTLRAGCVVAVAHTILWDLAGRGSAWWRRHS